MNRIHCPACGHHIADLDLTAPAPATPTPATTRGVTVATRVADWLATVERGRYAASDLRSDFVRDTGENVTAKEFGLALRSAGAVSRRGAGGERSWEVHGGVLNFRDWMLAQVTRDDPVGDLARDYQRDPDAGATPEVLRRRMVEAGAGEPARAALRTAYREWAAHRSHQSL